MTGSCPFTLQLHSFVEGMLGCPVEAAIALLLLPQGPDRRLADPGADQRWASDTRSGAFLAFSPSHFRTWPRGAYFAVRTICTNASFQRSTVLSGPTILM